MLSKRNDSGFLDVTKLVEGQKYNNLLCFATSVNSKISRVDKGYYTFYLKDVNSNIIPAQLFDVNRFVESGIIASKLKNCFLFVSFYAQIYNGRWSLIIDEVSKADPEKLKQQGIIIDYSRFRGSVNTSHFKQYKEIRKQLDLDEPTQLMETECISSICEGRSGGFAALVSQGALSLLNYDVFPEINVKTLLVTYALATDIYFNYLVKFENADVITNAKKVDFIQNSVLPYSNYKCSGYVTDTILALVGLCPAQHLYAHLICDTINFIMNSYREINTFSTIPMNLECNVGGELLLKY